MRYEQMNKPELLKDAKRVLVYRYGLDGEITVSKRLQPEEEMDFSELLDSGDVKIKSSSDSTNFIDFCGYHIDTEALAALDMIIGMLTE